MPSEGESSSKAAEIKPSETTATSNIRLKFDGLPKLQGQSNYQTWASAWRITFDAVDWWEALSIENPDENDTELSKTEIKKARKQMHSLLISAVCEEIQPTVVSAENAFYAWKALKDLYDRVSPNTTITLLSRVLDTKMQEGGSLTEHLATFDANWNTLKSRCQSADHKLAQALLPLTKSNEAMAAFLLSSLPKSMSNVVDNIQTKQDVTYEDVRQRLQNLDEVAPQTGNKVLHTRSTTSDKECTWCKKRGQPYKGHEYTECRKLKEQNKNRKGRRKDNSASVVVNDSTTTICMVRHDISQPLTWILDSGATSHVTPFQDQLINIRPHTGNVRTADGTNHAVTGMGSASFSCHLPDGSRSSILLTDVLLVPTLGNVGLVSETVLDKKGFRTESGGGSKLVTKEKKGIIWAKLEKGLWNVQVVSNTVRLTSYDEWHQALGHPATLENLYHDIQRLPPKPESFHCSQCALSKSVHKKPAPISTRSKRPFELIHSDLSGKFSIQSQGKAQYYMSFIDDYTRFAWIYLLKQKEDAKKAIKDYVTRIEKQYSTTILRFRTDGGGEYINKDITNYFDSQGIVHEQTPPYTPESNGVAERFNRTVTTMVRCMIMDHPKSLWGEAYATAVYLKNRLPHSTLKGKTPFEALKGTKPSIQHLQPFGKKCYVHIPENSRPAGSKLAPRAYEGIIVGYSDSDKIYRIWIGTQHRVIESRDVTFPPPESGEVSVELDFIPSLKPETANAPSDDGYESEDRSDPEPESNAIEENRTEMPGLFPESPELVRKPPPATPDKGKQPAVPMGQPRDPRDNWEKIPAPVVPFKGFKGKPLASTTPKGTPPQPPKRSDRIRQRKNREIEMEVRRKEYDEKVVEQQKLLTSYIEDVKEHGPGDKATEQELIDQFKEDFRRYRAELDLEYQDISKLPPNYQIYLVTEPSTFNQAMQSDDQHLWKKAIQTEKDALDKAHTWDIVNRPSNRAVVKGKWVFKVKHNADGTIERYKARYVAKGFTQVQYQDYDETFAPVARYDSLRLLLALAAHNGWIPQQMDVKSAFLYGVLKEEIYMELPEGYRQDNKVCKLRKCIYGLKQSPREWYACLADSLQRKGFVPAKFDPCVFIHKNHHLYISVYVDDIMIFGPDSPFRKEIRQLLKADFECTDLGNSKFILGIEITVTNNGITLSQRAYINKILDKFGMSNCKPVGTPLEPNLNLHKGEPEDQIEKPTEYQSIIGSLMYASIATRPDITHAVTALSQYSSCPTEDHLRAAKRTLRYLNGTKDWNLFYPKGNTRTLDGFSDSSYASDLDDRKSFSGYVFRLGKSAISWRSRKQKSVAVSTTEAEYMALSLAARQLVWIRNALLELQQQYQYFIHADNTGSIELCRNPRIHDRSKHIDVHYHYTREQLEAGTFEILYVPTEDNVADIMTKGLPKPAHQKLSELIRCGK
ncbi:uncharacterized protein H6S33_001448 [Morchella sextelata]|uniref:uncharacterized protein n=1 Tax=Morchella sextelata TaxID=1174677 RepID=UPI001D044D05|nr:uncharacterized protein H6S33_001448 [Morchella sextelata]KAH0609220.1 hypothetical protein H6S33_001448 [Morchella sextelata]